MIHQVRVIFGDTDQMGIAYYANYLRWFEAARGALLRERGLSGRDLTALGVGFPVAEAYCRYRKPAFYDDLLEVDITITEIGMVRIRFAYQIRRGADLVAEGNTLHACVDLTGRPVAIPDRLKAAFAVG